MGNRFRRKPRPTAEITPEVSGEQYAEIGLTKTHPPLQTEQEVSSSKVSESSDLTNAQLHNILAKLLSAGRLY